MPRGLRKIQEIAKENAAKRAAYEAAGPGIRKLILKDGETARVRFLESGDDVWFLWCHELPKQPGQRFGDMTQCLDQEDKGEPCGGCEKGVPRRARVIINLIWYNAPKFKREMKDGKPGKLVKDDNGNYIQIGNEDAVATWVRGPNDGGRLTYLHEKYEAEGGLTGIICTIHRQGSTKDDTKYMVDHEETRPPTATDRKLYESKPDPSKAIKRMSYGDMVRVYSGGSEPPQAGWGQGDAAGNVYAAVTSGVAGRGAFAEPAQSGAGHVNPSAFE